MYSRDEREWLADIAAQMIRDELIEDEEDTGSSDLVECFNCNGCGMFESGEECNTCKGTGLVEDDEED